MSRAAEDGSRMRRGITPGGRPYACILSGSGRFNTVVWDGAAVWTSMTIGGQRRVKFCKRTPASKSARVDRGPVRPNHKKKDF